MHINQCIVNSLSIYEVISLTRRLSVYIIAVSYIGERSEDVEQAVELTSRFTSSADVLCLVGAYLYLRESLDRARHSTTSKMQAR